MKPVVVDTNVVVAGLITGRDEAPTARIVEGMLGGRFPYALSVALLSEYRRVLTRPKLRAAHGLGPTEIDRVLEAMARHAIVLEPGASPRRAPDPGDQHLWDLLVAHDDLRLVTGDARLIDARDMRGRVVGAAEFAASLAGT